MSTMTHDPSAGPIEAGSPWERATFRAVPVEVTTDGAGVHAVRFQSEADGAFTLSASAEVAKALAGMLHHEIELTTEVHRAPDGTIEEGELCEYVEVADGDAGQAWRNWFAPHASHWEGEESIEHALGRGDDVDAL